MLARRKLRVQRLIGRAGRVFVQKAPGRSRRTAKIIGRPIDSVRSLFLIGREGFEQPC